MGEFIHTLNSSEKFDCPSCGEARRFTRYINVTTGEYLMGDYGKCDRVNSCGHDIRPEAKFVDAGVKIKVFKTTKNLYESSFYDNKHYQQFRTKLNRPNVFMQGLAKRFGKEEVMRVWDEYQLGNFWDGGMIYPYIFNGNIHTGKIMFYDKNLKRRHDKPNFWLHNYGQNGYELEGDARVKTIATPYVGRDYTVSYPLFGWDLIADNPDKSIGIVEGEKTAIICAICFPELVWVATGGLGGLQEYKFPFNSVRSWQVFPDLGMMKDKVPEITVKQYWETKINEIGALLLMHVEFPDFVPTTISDEDRVRANIMGMDIADFLLFYNERKEDAYYLHMKEIINKFV